MKNPKIQILRACGIIAVVLIHTCPSGEIQVFIRPFINYAVAIFLFIFGFLIDLSSINVKEFYKKRIIRVIIPYTIWSILYTTVGFFSNGINLKKYISNFLLAEGAATMYYIVVYIQFVLLTPLLGKMIKGKYWLIGFVIAPLSLLVKYYWLISGTIPNKIFSSLWNECCLGWVTYFYLGLYLRNINKDKKYKIVRLIIIYILSIIVQIVEGYWWYTIGDSNCGTQLKISSLLTSSIFILITFYYLNNDRFKGNCKVIQLIGDYSFGIYISHCMVITFLSKIIPHWNMIPFGINSFIVLSTTLMCTLIGRKILGDKASKYVGLY